MAKVTGQDVVMGIQHTFIMFGATVLVPLLTGLNIGVTLFAAGVGTLIFHVVTKFKVPVYLGSSFAFIPPIIAVSQAEGIPEALGGIFIAGLIYILVAILFRFIKIEILHRILPAHVTGPMIVLIGLILSPVAIGNSTGENSPAIVENIGVNGCWGVAFFTLLISIFVKIFFAKTVNKLL